MNCGYLAQFPTLTNKPLPGFAQTDFKVSVRVVLYDGAWAPGGYDRLI